MLKDAPVTGAQQRRYVFRPASGLLSGVSLPVPAYLRYVIHRALSTSRSRRGSHARPPIQPGCTDSHVDSPGWEEGDSISHPLPEGKSEDSCSGGTTAVSHVATQASMSQLALSKKS